MTTTDDRLWPALEHFADLDAMQRRANDLKHSGFIVLRTVEDDGSWSGYHAFLPIVVGDPESHTLVADFDLAPFADRQRDIYRDTPAPT